MWRATVVIKIRSLLLECGLVLPKGRDYVEHALPKILEGGELRLPSPFRFLWAQLRLKLEQITSRVEEMDRGHSENSKRELRTVNGSGRFQESAQSRRLP